MSREQFIGTWRLVSLEIETSDGEVIYPLGQDAVGIHTWDETGHFAFQGGKADREGFASDDMMGATPDEALSAINTYGAYFGTYEVDEKEGTVTHTGIGSLFPNAVGIPQKRSYKFSGNQLNLTADMTLGGKTVTARLLWERLTG